jgi:hypothetical protein
MTTLNHLLREADPLRHEAPPSLEAARERIRWAQSPTVSAGEPHRARRRPFVLASVCTVLTLLFLWASYRHGFPAMTPVAAQVRFEVRLAEARPVPGLRVEHVGNTDSLIYVHPEAVVGNEDVVQTWIVDDGSPRFAVGVQLQPAAGARMRQATADHIGRPVAILIDGTVVMAPTVRSPMGDSAVISGQFTREEANRIAQGLDHR